MLLPLSVLDLSPIAAGSTGGTALRNSIDLARHAEHLGLTRYWVAEHHNLPGVASTTPEILIGQIARETAHLRVGSGGVMLPNHAPLKVAESFRMLEALFPGRIDLGIGRAPGTDGVTALALRRSRAALGADDFPEQLAELFAFANGDFPAGHPFRAVTAVPADVALPPVWLLGSSDYSARLAADLGLGFAFAAHINAAGAVEAMHLYRERFTPSAALDRPWAILTLAVVCAETDERAAYLASSLELMIARLRSGRPGPVPSPEEALAYPFTPAERAIATAYRAGAVVGSPATARARLVERIEQTGADELMVVTTLHDHAARRHSYTLLAEALAGAPAGAAAPPAVAASAGGA